jgi:hypothetical protein
MLKIIPVLLFGWTMCGLAAQAEIAGVPKYPEKYKGKVRAELLLDEATGLLTYMLRCTSDEPVKIHLQSLDEAEIEFHIWLDVDLKKVEVDPADIVDPSANTTLPYGVKAKRVSAGRPPEKEPPVLDRVVELKKGEAVSRSFYLYDTPWFDALVKKLETKKFKAYRIDPWPCIYTVDAEGKPVIDHHVEVWNWENAHAGKFNAVYFTGGLILDLAKVKKLQALKAKAPPPPPPEIAMRMTIRPKAQDTARRSVVWDDERERGTLYRVVMEVLAEGGQFVPGSAKVVGRKPDTLEVLEGEGKNWKVEESTASRALFVRIMPAEEKPKKKGFFFSGRFQPREEGAASTEWRITATLQAEGREDAEEEK